MTDNIFDMQKLRDNNVTVYVGIYRDPEYILGAKETYNQVSR